MNKAKYKERIRKLLALSESPNENEAKSALLKAQALMAEYKISEAEVRDLKLKDEKVEIVETDIVFTGKTDPWVFRLALLIAENYACETWYRCYRGRQSSWICFMGLESDVRICESAFTYAVNYIRDKYDDFKKEYKGTGVKNIKTHYNSYAYGFIEGMRDSYNQQKASQCLDLVIVVPEKVKTQYNNMKFSRSSMSTSYGENEGSAAYSKGRSEGRSYGSTKGISGLKITG